MAKISPVSIKYMIYAKFEALGPVEKPDVIGALFGQTEGLLGSELEIRELQKEGKIGRIEVETEPRDGKTFGKIFVPTALDQSETSLIAAAIETIDRVGPTEARITVEKIEDVRGNKRDYIIERAKKLLESIEGSTSSREISGILRTESRTSRVQEYGDDKLPSGDLTGEEIIVVEGRADVMNLLENRVNNVISMNGTKLPKDVIELSKSKKITLFLDGDRGGKLIAKNVIENANIDFVAFAPDGKEVEELNGKEILASLRKKIPAKEFSSYSRFNNYNQDSRDVRENKKVNNYKEEKKEEKEIKKIDKIELREILSRDVENSSKVFFIDGNLNIISSVPKSRMANEARRARNAVILAIDGQATIQVIRIAEEAGIKCIAAKKFASSSSSDNDVEFVSF
ncbi:DNA primase [Candidatus Pacearchaeota archaeon]|nr:DNA primase [Candidatus Pacearchaeota archaeon]